MSGKKIYSSVVSVPGHKIHYVVLETERSLLCLSPFVSMASSERTHVLSPARSQQFSSLSLSRRALKANLTLTLHSCRTGRKGLNLEVGHL